MQDNDAYRSTNPLQTFPSTPSRVMHSGKVEVKRVLNSHESVASSNSETYYDDVISPLTNKLEGRRSLVMENTLAAGLNSSASEKFSEKTLKRFSMPDTSYSKLEHPVGIQSCTLPRHRLLSVGHSASNPGTLAVTSTHTTTSQTKHEQSESKSNIGDMAASSLRQSSHKLQAGHTQLSLSLLPKSVGDTHQLSQHSQGQSFIVGEFSFGE